MSANTQARRAEFSRATRETTIRAALVIDGHGRISIKTGLGLFDHILELIFFWAGMDLELDCAGDTHVDAHHTMEDCGLALGAMLLAALGGREGIARAAYARVPMDEALADVTVDISGRPWLCWHGANLLPPVIAGEEKDVWREFYKAFSSAGKFNLHISFLYGENGHHLLESAAKGLGAALRQAVKKEGETIRSTKGSLD